MTARAGTAARGRGEWQGWVAVVALAAALAFPLVASGGDQTYLLGVGGEAILAALFLLFAVLASLDRPRSAVGSTIIFVGAAIAAADVVLTLPAVAGLAPGPGMTASALVRATAGFWALVAAAWALAWLTVNRLSEAHAHSPLGEMILKIAIPLIFGASIILIWEVLVRGFAVPFVIMPPPSAIWARLLTSVPTLWVDFRQTFLKAVLAGYAIGCGSGFVVAILVDRVPFLRRGLLPIGNLVSALPIIGVAPIMVMWFGFDWPSKAAVVVAMTFFPMLVNTLAGLGASEAMERDLMRTYAAGYWQSLFKLRLPAALPFIFNALKINSTLAMIGAIVAEFFGTPVVGMGFRISTEVGRMNTDMVWAEIAVAALAGSVFYGVVALIERAVTFWHPSFRQQP
ncbi:MAG: ABC transporter permease [Bauldia sp.]|nr:MAG: ABC transporter permease [Bauldia sp.]